MNKTEMNKYSLLFELFGIELNHFVEGRKQQAECDEL